MRFLSEKGKNLTSKSVTYFFSSKNVSTVGVGVGVVYNMKREKMKSSTEQQVSYWFFFFNIYILNFIIYN